MRECLGKEKGELRNNLVHQLLFFLISPAILQKGDLSPREINSLCCSQWLASLRHGVSGIAIYALHGLAAGYFPLRLSQWLSCVSLRPSYPVKLGFFSEKIVRDRIIIAETQTGWNQSWFPSWVIEWVSGGATIWGRVQNKQVWKEIKNTMV